MGIILNRGGWLVWILLITSYQCHAQFRLGYGIKAGAVLASQTWEYANPDFILPIESRWGINVGIYVEVINQSTASLLTEVHYVQKGFQLDLPLSTPSFPEGTGEFITVSPRLDYISIPILVKARYDNLAITPYIVGGPRFDFLVGKNRDGVEVVYDQAKSTGIGISVGGGVEVPISDNIFLVEVTYSPNFDEVYSGKTLIVSNHSIELLIGIRI